MQFYAALIRVNILIKDPVQFLIKTESEVFSASASSLLVCLFDQMILLLPTESVIRQTVSICYYSVCITRV